jgi:outer membrane protein OmpA-like peptidoglycan-associated protein
MEAPPAEEQPAEEQAAPAPEEQPAEQQAAPEQQPEQQTTEQPAPGQPMQAEQPAEAQPAQQAEPAAEQPAQEQKPRRRRPDREAATQPPAPEKPAAEAAATDDTVEQQLEAQGDKKEANQVRTLREQLLDQLRQVIAPQPEPQQQQRPRQRDRQPGQADRRDRRDRYYNRDEQRGDVMEQRGSRIIIDLGGGRLYVEPTVPDEGGRLLYGADNVDVKNLPGGRTLTTVYRSDGSEIVTIRNRYGDIVRRSKVLPNGREIMLIDNRFDEHDRPREVIRDVAPPRVDIPRDRYVVDLSRASRKDVRRALTAPPVQRIKQGYSLDEVLRNEQIRAYSPRIDLDTITFDLGSATIGPDQMQSLLQLGQIMEEVIAENPDEVYLIEGHTDAVGSDYDNLILSDKRAEAVAVALSQNFDIPPENLVTAGYGEQYLKVPTQAAERRNRRATVRRLTELLQARGQ